MRALLAIGLAACSFDPSSATTGGPAPQDGTTTSPTDAPRSGDDDAPMIRPIDAAIDAHADACVDSDGDGVCDSVEWPCGDLPPALGSAIEVDHNGDAVKVIVSQIDLGGSGQRVVGTAGESVTLSVKYAISDTCSTCADQIEYGWGNGERIGCLYDSTPGTNTVTGNASESFKLPTAKGAYDFRINDGQNYGCNDPRGSNQVTTDGWWQANPGAANTIAKVCVH